MGLLSTLAVGTTRSVFGPVRIAVPDVEGSGGYADEGLPTLASLGVGSLLKTGTACADDGLAVALMMPASFREAMLAKFSESGADFRFFVDFSEPFLAGVFFGVRTGGTTGELVRFSLAIAEPKDGNISSSNVALGFIAMRSSSPLSSTGPEPLGFGSGTVALGLRGVCCGVTTPPAAAPSGTLGTTGNTREMRGVVCKGVEFAESLENPGGAAGLLAGETA